MRYLKNDIHLLTVITLSLILLGCNSFSDNEYQADKSTEWKSFFKEAGYPDNYLQNTLVMVLRTHECNSAVEEINWWRDHYLNAEITNIHMVVETRHPSVIKTFMEVHNLNFDVTIDTTFSVTKQQLVENTPKKILFDDNEVISKKDRIGGELPPLGFLKIE